MPRSVSQVRMLAVASIGFLAAFGSALQAFDGPYRVGGDVSRPELLTKVDPVYPEVARLSRLQGTVIVEVVIDEQGKVTEAKVLKGLPLGLSEASLTAVRQWSFAPARKAGKPAAVYYVLTVNFQMSEPDSRDSVIQEFLDALAGNESGIDRRLDTAERSLARLYARNGWSELEPLWCSMRSRAGRLGERCQSIPLGSESPADLIRIGGGVWVRADDFAKAADVRRWLAFGRGALESALEIDGQSASALFFELKLVVEERERAETPEARAELTRLAHSLRERLLAIEPRATEEGLLPRLD